MYSQTENSETTFTFKKLNNSIRLNHILVNMPTDKVSYDLAPKMSLVGLNYKSSIDMVFCLREQTKYVNLNDLSS